MRRIDDSSAHPFAGARMLRDLLRRGQAIGRRHVAPDARMGIEACIASRTQPRHPPTIYPYLLRDWRSRVPITSGRRYHLYPDGAGLCIFVCGPRLGESSGAGVAVVQHTDDRLLPGGCPGRPEPTMARPRSSTPIKGCQFTSQEFTGLLKAHGIQISMDGKGCWRDNVFVERLWKSIKYEEVYLHAYETVSAAHQDVERYLTFYNQPGRIGRLTARRQTRCTMTTCLHGSPPHRQHTRGTT